MYTITIQLSPSADQILRSLDSMTPRIMDAIRRAHDYQNELTASHITLHRMTGNAEKPYPPEEGRLRNKTGWLRRSVRRTDAVISGTSVVSAIGSNMSYAGIHEFGGTTRAHVIRPKNKRWLKFEWHGNTVYRRSVNHPGSNIPARAPIRRGIEDRIPNYSEAISRAIVEAAKPISGAQ